MAASSGMYVSWHAHIDMHTYIWHSIYIFSRYIPEYVLGYVQHVRTRTYSSIYDDDGCLFVVK